MMSTYSQSKTREMIKTALENPATFYKQPFLNYRGKTPCGRAYSAIIADEFLKQNGGRKIEKSVEGLEARTEYKIETHKGKFPTAKEEINTEKRLAIALFNLKHIGSWEILDYQTPLKTQQDDDPRGEIDLVAKDKKNDLHLIELKPPESKETIIRAALEIFTYLKTVQNVPAFKTDFDADNANLIADILLPESITSTLEKLPEVKQLLRKLDVEVYSYDLTTLKGLKASLPPVTLNLIR